MNQAQAVNLIRQSVKKLDAYHLAQDECAIKLNQNENPFDWPQEIKEEAAAFCTQRAWNRYPPFISDQLKSSLAAYAGVRPEQVIAGNGSNEMLLVLMLSLLDTQRPVIICEPTFTVYRLLARGMEGSVCRVQLNRDLTYAVDGIIAACKKHPQSIFICASPNNPTGKSLDKEELCSILDAHGGFCILDQAYVEFGGYNAVRLLDQYPNLVITRTFSKALGGAGFRIGYMLGNAAVMNEMNKIKLPYNINFFSEHVARLLLSHADVISARLVALRAERDRMYACLRQLPFDTCFASDANFILVRTPRHRELIESLKKQSILVRDVSGYPMLDQCIRISVGTPDENSVLENALSAFFSIA
ncbi:MAG: histidinol-phosphate transaminase [Chitinivibrionales bacterium]|nr:histidinol-phosphate transaminase [Chitinivibrionales bacterium]